MRISSYKLALFYAVLMEYTLHAVWSGNSWVHFSTRSFFISLTSAARLLSSFHLRVILPSYCFISLASILHSLFLFPLIWTLPHLKPHFPSLFIFCLFSFLFRVSCNALEFWNVMADVSSSYRNFWCLRSKKAAAVPLLSQAFPSKPLNKSWWNLTLRSFAKI